MYIIYRYNIYIYTRYCIPILGTFHIDEHRGPGGSGYRAFTHRLQAERGGMAARPETIEVGTGLVNVHKKRWKDPPCYEWENALFLW